MYMSASRKPDEGPTENRLGELGSLYKYYYYYYYYYFHYISYILFPVNLINVNRVVYSYFEKGCQQKCARDDPER